jgi:hypothetical protein
MKTPVAIFAVLSITGCASTAIRTPYGTYTSTKDVSLTEFKLLVELREDGQPSKIDVAWGGAKGNASDVIGAQAALLRAAFQAGMDLARSAPVP